MNPEQGIQACMERVAEKSRGLARSGRVASYIPALQHVDPSRFAMAVATLDGSVHEVGDSRVPFSIQSISKVFSLVLAYQIAGEGVWARVGRLPSSNQFNSLIELELGSGIPRNPFLNPGALAVADLLVSRHTCMEGAVVQLLRELSGNPAVDYDLDVAAGEFESAHRNKAAAYLMKSLGNLSNPVEDVVRAYCAQCSIACSCRDLAVAGLFLANAGADRAGRRILQAREAQEVCALMMSSGTYEASGETAFTVGLPTKSGVGGGVISVIPRFGTVCAWSPPLDESGTSVAALKAVELFAAQMRHSVFA